MALKWYYIEDSPNRCMCLGDNGAKSGEPIQNIVAKVWRFTDGSWGYACSSSCLDKKQRTYGLGHEPNKSLAKGTVERVINPLLLEGEL